MLTDRFSASKVQDINNPLNRLIQNISLHDTKNSSNYVETQKTRTALEKIKYVTASNSEQAELFCLGFGIPKHYIHLKDGCIVIKVGNGRPKQILNKLGLTGLNESDIKEAMNRGLLIKKQQKEERQVDNVGIHQNNISNDNRGLEKSY